MFRKAYSTIWENLVTAYQREKLSHALLFSGPKGTAKEPLVFELIRLVGEIAVSDEVLKKGYHPDVLVVRPVVEKKKEKIRQKKISVEQLKPVMEKVGLYPYQAKKKIVLVLEAQEMSVGAANSMLKLIEEPLSDTMIMLVADNEEMLLPTILSRCQKIRVGLLSDEKLKELADSYVESQGLNRQGVSLEDAVNYAHGRLEDSWKLLKDEDFLAERKTMVDAFRDALRGDLSIGFSLAEKIASDDVKIKEHLDEWIWYLRNFLKQNVKNKVDIRIQKKVFFMLKEMLEVRRMLEKTNVNERLFLENFFIKLK